MSQTDSKSITLLLQCGSGVKLSYNGTICGGYINVLAQQSIDKSVKSGVVLSSVKTSPQTATILYVSIEKQLTTFITQFGGGGTGHCGVFDGVKHGVLVGVGVGVGDAQGLPLVELGVGVGVGVCPADALGVGVGKLEHEQFVSALPS